MMSIMAAEKPVTLKEVQLRLGAPQHVLIHLCEKGVIEPDVTETSGRGKRREFSQRNLFEFAVALTLRRLELSVATTAFIVRLLRSFARATRKLVPGFELPASLVDRDLQLALRLHDDRFLVFSAGGEAVQRPLLLGVRVDTQARGPNSRPRIEKLQELPGDHAGMLLLNLTQIAKNLLK